MEKNKKKKRLANLGKPAQSSILSQIWKRRGQNTRMFRELGAFAGHLASRRARLSKHSRFLPLTPPNLRQYRRLGRFSQIGQSFFLFFSPTFSAAAALVKAGRLAAWPVGSGVEGWLAGLAAPPSLCLFLCFSHSFGGYATSGLAREEKRANLRYCREF